VALVPATVHLLARDAAREQFPDLFECDEDDRYFNELGAHGNARWVDYWPDLVMIVCNAVGDVVMTSNASEWWMKSVGFMEDSK
jgi:hypothetical protein